MTRFLAFLLILVGLAAPLSAQETTPFTSQDGNLTFDLPEGWEAIDNGTEPPSVLLINPSIFSDLMVYNIRNECGSAGAFVNPLAFSCDPQPEALLPYAMENFWYFPTETEKQFFKDGEIACVKTVDASRLGCARDAGDSYFFLYRIEGITEDATNYLDEAKTILNSATYGTAPAVSASDFPEPEIVEDGWTLDVSAFALSLEARIVPGADGRIYIADAGKILAVNQDGTVEHFIESNTLPYVLDFAVTSDGRIWVVDNAQFLQEFDTEGQLIETVDLSPESSATVLQIEATTDGQLVALEYDEITGEANVILYDPDDLTQTRFSIVEEGEFYFEAEAFLSMARLGASSADEIYVFSEYGNIIRVFNSEGEITIAAVNEEPIGYFNRFGFSEDGVLDTYEDDTFTRFNLDDLSAKTFLLPTPSSVLIDDTQLLSLSDDQLRLETWEPVSANE